MTLRSSPFSRPPLQELRAESPTTAAGAPLLLDRESTERALMARLSNPPPQYPQWPVQYLLGCYGRAVDEARGVGGLKDPADQQRLGDTLALARQLTVSYTGFVLTMGMFPQPDAAETRAALQLLDSLYASAAAGASEFAALSAQPVIPPEVAAATTVVPMPPSFLTEYAERFKEEGFEETLAQIGEG